MSPTQSRFLWGTVLTLTLLWIGLTGGTAIGAQLVPKGSGLAGGAIAVAYGIGAALAAGLLGVLLVWRLPTSALRAASFVTIAISLVIAGLVGWRIVAQSADQRAKAGLDEPLPEPADLRVHAEMSEREPTRSYREIDVDGSTWGFRFIAVGPEAAECRGVLNATEALTLLSMAAVDLEQVCSEPGGEPVFTVEVERDGRSQHVAADAACVQGSVEIQRLMQTLFRIPLDGVSYGRVSCN